ncbi:TetR/AcrR family transcriptional regulator [Sinorhizobium medicae]|uniref:TetR/AcrR family transcriptional regulator n=1 Tax=Sinorhizobium medicae TaxID=110321 RepID=UPI0002FF872A|nr:TetR/AcrR family transcriptional regulator [Sinorhizobium medicae]UFX05543.1 TetR/AcrR family transcriptional regulator [Sinorhizobium medicae WSM1115]UWU12201.1 TetR/AcrR family transcriptional regulator [Sinorhizobium medicae]WQO47490.1 TetR/AcrR family transcriptional regulator [Sinorhizobium medicae]WQO60958.1 TetR/AcrR family transcriptional regulator [Sinorhizobium medicae]WQO68629.1 TetR/AcrR family transcriptional regulator [Sinorhizobium medicae]
MTRKAKELTRNDWVLAGLAALAEGGIDSVRVERLAKSLNVSKGSFYWHFSDRSDLLSALLDLWEKDFTAQLIANVASQPTPRARLLALAEEALDASMDGVDVAQAEGAFSAWAVLDPAAAVRVRAIEAQRIGYLVRELSLMGADTAQAELLAKGIYLALLGVFAARRYNPALAEDAVFRRIVALALDAVGGRRR